MIFVRPSLHLIRKDSKMVQTGEKPVITWTSCHFEIEEEAKIIMVLMIDDDDECGRWNEWKREKSYFSNLLHNLSVSCTKNISHCQTNQPSQGQEHKMFFQSSRNRNSSQCGRGSKIICLEEETESYFLCDGRKCLHKEQITFYLLPTKTFPVQRSSLTQGQGQKSVK